MTDQKKISKKYSTKNHQIYKISTILKCLSVSLTSLRLSTSLHYPLSSRNEIAWQCAKQKLENNTNNNTKGKCSHHIDSQSGNLQVSIALRGGGWDVPVEFDERQWGSHHGRTCRTRCCSSHHRHRVGAAGRRTDALALGLGLSLDKASIGCGGRPLVYPRFFLLYIGGLIIS
jgi:hypothetical protein